MQPPFPLPSEVDPVVGLVPYMPVSDPLRQQLVFRLQLVDNRTAALGEEPCLVYHHAQRSVTRFTIGDHMSNDRNRRLTETHTPISPSNISVASRQPLSTKRALTISTACASRSLRVK